MMKKLINTRRQVVRDMLAGIVASDPTLALMADMNVVLRADIPADPEARPVAVLSGGGSGHEPAHAGYVGAGMLSAAIAGDVFTSPSVDAVHAALLAAAGPAGALLIVKNYTGDRLNFSLAAEMARAEGIPTEIVFVADDVALQGLVPRERRRGLAGTVLVHKVAGAAAAAGQPLATVARLARETAGRLGTMGVALGACTVPTAGQPSFELGPDDIEFGLGIHGEKGVERVAMMPAGAIVARMLDMICADLGLTSGPVALLVNGLGGTPPMELSIVAGLALAGLRQRELEPRLIWTGNFMTALEMAGCSLTLLPLSTGIEPLLEAPTGLRVWPSHARVGTDARILAPVSQEGRPSVAVEGPLSAALRAAARRIADALAEAEPHLTELDSRAGDGDLGASMYRGAETLRALPDHAFNTPGAFCRSLSDGLRRAIAGSSGPFYATALMRMAHELDEAPAPEADAWDRAMAAAIGSVSEIGGAGPGDRTMVDALAPALAMWQAARAGGASPRQALAKAAVAARAGAAATAQMTPRLGRASYLGDRAKGAPDGGAEAVAIWLEALAAG